MYTQHTVHTYTLDHDGLITG